MRIGDHLSSSSQQIYHLIQHEHKASLNNISSLGRLNPRTSECNHIAHEFIINKVVPSLPISPHVFVLRKASFMSKQRNRAKIQQAKMFEH